MLNKIKLLLGLTDTSKDELLMVLIESAIQEVKNYIHDDDITGLENCICDMVIYHFNLLGSEGVSSESYSGVTFDYSQDYPEKIMSQLRARRKIKIC